MYEDWQNLRKEILESSESLNEKFAKYCYFLENLLKTKEKKFVEVGLLIELMKIINLNLMKKVYD